MQRADQSSVSLCVDGATTETDANLGTDHAHSPRCKMRYAHTVQAALCGVDITHSRGPSASSLASKNHITIAGSRVQGLWTLWHHFQVAAGHASQLIRDNSRVFSFFFCTYSYTATHVAHHHAQVNVCSQVWMLFLVLLIVTSPNSCSGGA